jgi:hypothetical protein
MRYEKGYVFVVKHLKRSVAIHFVGWLIFADTVTVTMLMPVTMTVTVKDMIVTVMSRAI